MFLAKIEVCPNCKKHVYEDDGVCLFCGRVLRTEDDRKYEGRRKDKRRYVFRDSHRTR